jgi:hypothetical protein
MNALAPYTWYVFRVYFPVVNSLHAFLWLSLDTAILTKELIFGVIEFNSSSHPQCKCSLKFDKQFQRSLKIKKRITASLKNQVYEFHILINISFGVYKEQVKNKNIKIAIVLVGNSDAKQLWPRQSMLSVSAKALASRKISLSTRCTKRRQRAQTLARNSCFLLIVLDSKFFLDISSVYKA